MSKNLSHSSISTFQSCHRKYYYSYIKKYQAKTFNLPYLMGRVIHLSISHLLSSKSVKVATLAALTNFNEEVKKEKTGIIILDPTILEQLNQQESILKGIIAGYANYHSRFVKDCAVIDAEKKISYELNKNVNIIGYTDHSIKYKDKLYVHELKSSKTLDVKYVRGIQVNLQAMIYRFIKNQTSKKPFSILFDVIKKPSIRLKKKETKIEFVARLGEYYSDTVKDPCFHHEFIDKPIVSDDELLNNLTQVTDDIIKRLTKEDFYKTQNAWNCDYCDFWRLCYSGGETVKNLQFFKLKTK